MLPKWHLWGLSVWGGCLIGLQMLFIVLDWGCRLHTAANDEFGVDGDILTQPSSDMAACQCARVSKQRRHHLSFCTLPVLLNIDLLWCWKTIGDVALLSPRRSITSAFFSLMWAFFSSGAIRLKRLFKCPTWMLLDSNGLRRIIMKRLIWNSLLLDLCGLLLIQYYIMVSYYNIISVDFSPFKINRLEMLIFE